MAIPIPRALRHLFIATTSHSPDETARQGYALGKALAATDPDKKWEIALSDTLGIPPSLVHMGKTIFTAGCLQGYEEEIKKQAKQRPELGQDYSAFDNAYDKGKISMLSMLPYLEILDVYKPFNKRKIYNGDTNHGDLRTFSRGPKSFKEASRGLKITDHPGPTSIIQADSWIAIRYKLPFNYWSKRKTKNYTAPRILCFSHYNAKTRDAWEACLKLLEDRNFKPTVDTLKGRTVNYDPNNTSTLHYNP